MKEQIINSNWNPSQGDYVKKSIIEQRRAEKKSRKRITLAAGISAGILLLIVIFIYY